MEVAKLTVYTDFDWLWPYFIIALIEAGGFPKVHIEQALNLVQVDALDLSL